MSAIADADDAGFSCTVTCDANNNITQIEEVQTLGMDTATLTTDSKRLSAGHTPDRSVATETHSHLCSTHVRKCPTAYDWGHASMLFAGASPVYGIRRQDAAATVGGYSGGEKLASNHPANRRALA